MSTIKDNISHISHICHQCNRHYSNKYNLATHASFTKKMNN